MALLRHGTTRNSYATFLQSHRATEILPSGLFPHQAATQGTLAQPTGTLPNIPEDVCLP